MREDDDVFGSQVSDTSATLINGNLNAQFRRPIAAQGTQDVALNLPCVCLQFPVTGGDIRNGRWAIHHQEPTVRGFNLATCQRCNCNNSNNYGSNSNNGNYGYGNTATNDDDSHEG